MPGLPIQDYKERQVQTLPAETGVYALCDRDEVPIYGVQLAVVAERDSVTSVSLLQRRHDSALRSVTSTSGKSLYQNFAGKSTGQEAMFRRNPLL